MAAACLFLLLALQGAMPAISATNDSHFYFVQITDTHWGSRDGIDITRRAVQKINELPVKVEFVAHTGDVLSDNITNTNIVNEGLAVLKELKAPVHFVAGNHDILSSNAEVTAALFTRHFGPLASKAEHMGVVFIFVYTEPLADRFTLKDYDPIPAAAGMIRKAGSKPVIIFHHTPSMEDFHKNSFHPGWPKEVRETWEKLMQSPTVVSVIAGHFHRDELHWIGKTPEYVSAPLITYWGRQPSFRLYEYSAGRLGYSTIYMERDK